MVMTHIGRVNSNPTPPKAIKSASISRIAEAVSVWLRLLDWVKAHIRS